MIDLFFPSFRHVFTLMKYSSSHCGSFIYEESFLHRRKLEINHDFVLINFCTGDTSRRKKPSRLKPLDSTSQQIGQIESLKQPKKDREQFRKALVDIILWVIRFWWLEFIYSIANHGREWNSLIKLLLIIFLQRGMDKMRVFWHTCTHRYMY